MLHGGLQRMPAPGVLEQESVSALEEVGETTRISRLDYNGQGHHAGLGATAPSEYPQSVK